MTYLAVNGLCFWRFQSSSYSLVPVEHLKAYFNCAFSDSFRLLSNLRSGRIVFRAFQGVGAAGVFVVATVMIYEIVPKKKLPMFGGLAFAVVALATVIGPLLGGAVAFHTNWRWIFLLK